MKRYAITVLAACTALSAPALAGDRYHYNNDRYDGARHNYNSGYYYGSQSEHDYNHRALKLTGGEVRDIQRALHDAGYNAGPVDGVVGPRTRAAVKAFQYDRRIPGDGKITARTTRALHGYQWGWGWGIRGQSYDHRLHRNYN